ncbi:tyrosine-type recombinase/integrase [Pseudonocardia sp. GCM10023141]|uniref:tyrosine-type recombinase/integrase n=1 Tax=Pseudonocardia sp. GCM10023141 TaxID=3252653 RepID=UPI0036099FFC
MPRRCVNALTIHRARLGRAPQLDALVFPTSSGREMDAHNVRRAFRAVARTAGLDASAWTPRELRHSFVSLLSDSGMPIEQIARLLGHSGTTVTERVYRHQLRPVLEEGAESMDALFPTADAG